jgi:hypothetical protein
LPATPPPMAHLCMVLLLVPSSTQIFITPATPPPTVRLHMALFLAPPPYAALPHAGYASHYGTPLYGVLPGATPYTAPIHASHAAPYSAVTYIACRIPKFWNVK